MLNDSSTSVISQNTLRAQLLTLRIIVAALAMGVATYGAFTISQNIDKPQVLAGKLTSSSMMFLGLGIVALVLGILVPRVIFAATRRRAPLNPTPGLTLKQLRVFSIQQRVQTCAIIGCALFEGAAFANIFGYATSRELLHLVFAGILLLGILAHYPSAAFYQQRIEHELRRLDEEDAFTSQGRSLMP